MSYESNKRTGEEAGHLGRSQMIKGFVCHAKELNVIFCHSEPLKNFNQKRFIVKQVF